MAEPRAISRDRSAIAGRPRSASVTVLDDSRGLTAPLAH
jgi:hypothetical protein